MLSSLQNFIRALAKLPSIGPRLATRTAFYLLSSPDNLAILGNALAGLKGLERCPTCFFLKEKDRSCELCSASRDPAVLAVVEKETDLLSIESAGAFRGRYLVLGDNAEGGRLSSIAEKRLSSFLGRLREGEPAPREIILALPPNSLGDLTADLLQKALAGVCGKITRLARGLPTGAEVEFADPETIRQAVEERR